MLFEGSVSSQGHKHIIHMLLFEIYLQFLKLNAVDLVIELYH